MSSPDPIARGGPESEALEQELLTRLVALNHARAAEEKRGLVRWLRPEYQNAAGAASEATEQSELSIPDASYRSLMRAGVPALLWKVTRSLPGPKNCSSRLP